MFSPGATAMPHVESGALKALAVTTARRTAFAPNIPTMAEAGLEGYDVSMWNGIFAPAGTSAEIIQRLAAVATKAVRSEALQQKIKSNGGDPAAMEPQEFAAYIDRDIEKWATVAKGAGIQPQQ
jgi:tripartite-type tricarboxylate transporter receptor subunit TctC